MATVEVSFEARGHEHVVAEHGSTLEVTTEDWLTPAGDCIVAVAADRAPADLGEEFVDACRSADATVELELAVDAGDRVLSETVTGRGHPDLSLEDEVSMVARTSDYVDDRTVMVGADRAAADLDRDLVRALSLGAPVEVTLRVEDS